MQYHAIWYTHSPGYRDHLMLMERGFLLQYATYTVRKSLREGQSFWFSASVLCIIAHFNNYSRMTMAGSWFV